MITRLAAAAYLDGQYDNLAREINQLEHADGADGYGPDIDQALRSLGTPEDQIELAAVENAEVLVYYALCDYYALRRFARQLATKVDTGLPAQFALEGDRPRVFENVMDLLAEATARVEEYGYPGGVPDELSQSGWEYVSLNLGYLAGYGSEWQASRVGCRSYLP
jgi:hypothetical protein